MRVVLAVLAASRGVAALNFASNFQKLLTKRDPAFIFQEFPSFMPGAMRQAEESAIAACAEGSRAKILEAVDQLEIQSPVDDLLDGAGAAALDGRWKLLATVAGRTPGDDLSEGGVTNAVNASGIVLDVRDRLPLQIFSVSDGRVANEVQLEFLRQGLTIRVSGSFSRGANGRRADVSFDNFELFGGDGRRTAEARWLFALVNRFRPALATGDEATSWLETTYLSPTLRVGRGNKGSVFILQKDDEPSRLDPATF